MADKTETSSESATYQNMLKEVETIVGAVSSNPMDLDEMVKNVEKGYSLIKTMRERLDTTKDKIEKLRVEYSDES